jgi:hypothetical protein
MRIGAVALRISLAITLVAPEAADASVYDINLTEDMAAAMRKCRATLASEDLLCIAAFLHASRRHYDFGQVTIFMIWAGYDLPGFANKESTQEIHMLYETGNVWVSFVGPVAGLPLINTTKYSVPFH